MFSTASPRPFHLHWSNKLNCAPTFSCTEAKAPFPVDSNVLTQPQLVPAPLCHTSMPATCLQWAKPCSAVRLSSHLTCPVKLPASDAGCRAATCTQGQHSTMGISFKLIDTDLRLINDPIRPPCGVRPGAPSQCSVGIWAQLMNSSLDSLLRKFALSRKWAQALWQEGGKWILRLWLFKNTSRPGANVVFSLESWWEAGH
jgi:hypothetical protein